MIAVPFLAILILCSVNLLMFNTKAFSPELILIYMYIFVWFRVQQEEEPLLVEVEQLLKHQLLHRLKVCTST